MVLLITATEAKDWLATAQGLGSPTNMTDTRIQSIITGVSAQLLRRAGLTADPGAGLLQDELKEICRELVSIKIRMELFAGDREMMETLRLRWEEVFGNSPEIEQLEEASAGGLAQSSITPTRRFERWTDDEERIAQ